MSERTIEAMREISTDLMSIEMQLADLQDDAEAHHLHRAVERIRRMRSTAATTAKGLNIQAAKEASRLKA